MVYEVRICCGKSERIAALLFYALKWYNKAIPKLNDCLKNARETAK